MNKYLHRIIWSKVRVCWVVVCESASAVSGGRPRRTRAKRGVALSLAFSIALPSFSPLALAAPGFTSPAPRPAVENAAPTSPGKDGKDGKEKQPSGLENSIARSVQGMARAQAQQRPNDPSALK